MKIKIKSMNTVQLRVLGLLPMLNFVLGSGQSYGGHISYGHQLVYHFPRPQQFAMSSLLATQQFVPVKNSNLNSPQDTKVRAEIPNGSEQFSFDMIYAISNAIQYYDVNFVISPFSVWSLMILIAEGAVDQSLAQLKNVLHLPNDLTRLQTAYTDIQRVLTMNTSATQLTVSQALFFDANRPVENTYANTLMKGYMADHFSVNFRAANEAAKTINDYINYRTNGKIKNVVSPEDLIDTQLLLTSSIFFKGLWKLPFNVSETIEQPFYRENGDYVGHVPMMTQKNLIRYAAIKELGASFIELPYGDDDRLAMILINPNSTLNTVFRNLKQYEIAKLHDEIKKSVEDDEPDVVDLTLPRFKITSDLELRTVLEHLGISDVFDANKAKLPKISRQQPPMYVSRVFQKAIIQVDEIGTVAAAATVGSISNRIIPKEFVLNRPFGFLITDRLTNTLLFAGQVRNPLA